MTILIKHLSRSKIPAGGKQRGFSLMELLIVIAIIGVIAAIGYPSYIDSVTKTKRKAAAACLSEYANYMERFYTTNLRYDQDSGATANALPALNCSTDNDMNTVYTFNLAAVAQSTYSITAVPQGSQASRDAKCGTLSLNQTGNRGVTGTSSANTCW